jgi:site-specific DNA-methyltransferase (adenine-specific)/modification methylase
VIDLHCGDCLEILPKLGRVDAVVSDPPWGVKQDSDNTRFPSINGDNKTYRQIAGDDKPFDPSPWLKFPRVALFGANCFSDRLPIGSWLVWCKRRDSMLGKFLADAETVWINKGFGVYILQHEWHGSLKASERGQKRVHPHQKPIAVMRWCLERLKLKPGSTILDPYMGSGTTGVAAVELGFNFVGVELDPAYFAIAERRIAEAVAA